ncbi:hypothetical protein CC99x_009525 [Candidatus Berkiella cookevillensis]|uniref:Tyrosine kinase n=1 Tax=Candidatus Berkiella cookevillensis TaxID=437022 RepID=A0A0Q9YMR6_9GAMM|nr:XrtA system polysaccharide chain length determinant [Candidatus Berkiella cookevillensis]MCS5709144.1 hypothetical protein [Candidatus Berkiella cookevillensis]
MDLSLLLDKAKNYLIGIWLYRWYAVISAWIVVLIGWSVIANLPNHYQSIARVYIDTQSLIKPLMKDLSVSTDSNERISQVARTIFNRPNLEKIAQMSDLDLNVKSRHDKEVLLDKLLHEIKLKREGATNLFVIRYEHHSRDKAKLVVQSILNLFQESTLSNTRTDTMQAQKFLDEQIGAYEEQLVLAEMRLANFKREHLGTLPREDKTYYERLQTTMSTLENTKMKLEVAIKRRDAIQKQIDGEEPIFGLSVSHRNPLKNHPLAQKLNQLEAQEILLLTRYTENHPDVKNLKKEIEEIKISLSKIEETDLLGDAFDSLSQNPVYQQMRIAFNEAHAEVASVQAAVRELEAISNDMRQKIDAVIKSEMEFASLNRDYLTHKQKYQSLLEKREAAKLAEEMDDTQQIIKFRIIDPPFVPLEPAGPNRILYGLAMLLIGVFTGLGVAFARSQLNPAALHKMNLESFTGLPVLEQIPIIASHASSHLLYRYRTIWTVCSCSALLFLTALCLVVLYYYQIGPRF